MFRFLKNYFSIEEGPITKRELEKIKSQNASNAGFIKTTRGFFEFHHAGSFYETYKEIFEDNIYQFHPVNQHPLIIDCGANMGLSVLYFSEKYPSAKIIAFEPEEEIFNVLRRNSENLKLKNINLHKKAVWDSETTLKFYSDKGMGGSVTNIYQYQEPRLVETVVLADYLHQKVDLLKLDIEGAEFRVLKSCSHLLKNVENIFVEYHSFIHEEQHLEDLLQLLKENGFRYHLRQSFSRQHPFTDDVLACENMDMAINVFAYRVDNELNDQYFENNQLKDSERPLVSLCIPVYNGAAYLQTALDSAVNQTYSPLEILIVDDGSTDNTLEIAKSYSQKHPNIKLHFNQQNQGLVGNWKKCIELAAGDWIKFLFQDDYMQPRCVEKMMTVCVQNNVQFALCAREFIFEKNVEEKVKNTFINQLSKPENIFIRKNLYSPNETSRLISMHLIENVLGEPICTLFHKNLYYSCGGFNERLKQMVDYEFALKIVLNHPFAFVKEKLVNFRVHMDSTTSKNVLRKPEHKATSDSVILSTTGDFLELMELYQNNEMFTSVKESAGEEILKIQQEYLYCRACKYNGKSRINKLLKDIIENSKILRNYHYNIIRYKIVKRRFRKKVKPYLNRQPV